MGIEYRPEIDGLRAIAVLAVVLFHAGIGNAGFVGVDVFFVISGYLITSLLVREWRETRRIDLRAFYARRVRRIVPAATTVVVFALVVGQQLLSAEAQALTERSAGAALLFVANVFFQVSTGGYFDPDSSAMPLLHLWSLSVEEQFYLAWPVLLLLVLGRRPAALRPVIAILVVGSLALAEYLVHQGSDAAFYQMPARFWELAAGGAIAVAPAKRLPAWMGWAGVLVTLAACVVTPGHFPGLGALPAVAGASLVIAAVHGGARNALLRNRAMVGVGLVSYSLYLWHWPLLALYRATTIGEPPVSTRLALCAIALVLAVATYRYIEQPFRRRRYGDGATVKVGVATAALLAAVAFSLGWSVNTGGTADNPLAVQASRDVPSRKCHSWMLAPVGLPCPTDADTVVWGDSMGYAWMPAFPGAAEATRDACAPIVGYLGQQQRRPALLCRDHNALVPSLPARTVVLVARWWVHPDIDLSPTLDALAGKRVVIIGPSPEMRDAVPHCIRQRSEPRCAVPRREFDAVAKPILEKLRAAAAGRAGVHVVDVTPYFCSETECPPLRDGVPQYWDTHHVSKSAATAIGKAGAFDVPGTGDRGKGASPN